MKIPVTDDDFLDACKEAINTRYESIAFRKKWRWRRRQFDLHVPAKHETGTVALTNADRLVTGTATAWTADHVGQWFRRTGDDEMYRFVSVDVAAQTALLSAVYTGTTGTALTYMTFQFQFGIVPDAEEIDLVWHDHRRKTMDLISPRELKELVISNPFLEGFADACTIEGFTDYKGPDLGQFVLGQDYLGGDDQDDLMMSIFPHIPDDAYTIHLDYMVKITPLDADADQPIIPLEKRHILVYGALADMFFRERMDETGVFWEKKFDDSLREMEQDHEYTDEKPVMKVPGTWWRRRRMRTESRFDRFLRD